jgi:hypothetical protein
MFHLMLCCLPKHTASATADNLTYLLVSKRFPLVCIHMTGHDSRPVPDATLVG